MPFSSKVLTFGLPGRLGSSTPSACPAGSPKTFACEATGGVLLVLGIKAGWVALLLSPFLLGAIFAVHLVNGWVFTAPNGGWEYPAHLFVLCLAQAFLGDGAFALAPSRRFAAPAAPAPAVQARGGV